MKEECRVTKISLDNAKELINVHGYPADIVILYSPELGNMVKAQWSDGYNFNFTGFSWGYKGEGVRGLHDFLEMCGITFPIDELAGLDSENPRIKGFKPPKQPITIGKKNGKLFVVHTTEDQKVMYIDYDTNSKNILEKSVDEIGEV